MLPEPNEQIVAEGLALRLGQYLNKKNLAALLTAALLEVQEIQDMLWDVINSQLLTRTFPAGTAQGELDGPPDQALLQTASLVGAPTGTYTTRQLAFLITIWIAARKSNGTAEDILGILTTAFPPVAGAASFSYDEGYPAAYQVTDSKVPNVALIGPVAQALAIARPAGVLAVLAWGNWPTQTFFCGDSVSGLAGSGLEDSVGGSDVQGLLTATPI